jgi:DNA-binding PadR family transcriptional regulator
MTGARRGAEQLLLSEWACLGILGAGPAHGFAIAARLRPDGDVGRVWSVSRALTYRALAQLVDRGLVRAVGEERGIAGGNRTVLAITRSGRGRVRTWLSTPVAHLRDLRSELLLKLTVADLWGVDVSPMLHRQRERIAELSAALAAEVDATAPDVVALWRSESSRAALRFLDRLNAR